MTPKVSVIVPIYNAGIRLQNCIDSILAQTLKEIEVICVLDCPTDGSDKIVEEFAAIDSRIKIIRNSQNLNTGNSRNAGMQVAIGEYLAFSDHDDIVMPDMYEKLYTLAKKQSADMVLGCPEYTYPDSVLNASYFYPEVGDVRERLLSCIIGRRHGDSDSWGFFYNHGLIWDNLYRRKMVHDKGINFVDNNIITFEDNLFMIECLLEANKAIVYNEVIYQHTILESNTASSSGYTRPDKILAYIDYLYDVLKNNNKYDLYIENYSNSSSRYMIGMVTRSFLGSRNIKEISVIIKMIKANQHKKEIFSFASFWGMLAESQGFVKKLTYALLFVYLKIR